MRTGRGSVLLNNAVNETAWGCSKSHNRGKECGPSNLNDCHLISQEMSVGVRRIV